jgi:voltage-gated potassium channel
MKLTSWENWPKHHQRLLKRLAWVFGATLAVDFVGTVLVYYAERHARGTEIRSFGDASFFTSVQLLTVSSQIRNPLTTWGRVVDVFLEIWAVVVVAGSAGAMADFFHQGTAKRVATQRSRSSGQS